MNEKWGKKFFKKNWNNCTRNYQRKKFIYFTDVKRDKQNFYTYILSSIYIYNCKKKLTLRRVNL